MKDKRDSLPKNMKNLPVQKHTDFLDEIIDWLERNWQVGTKIGFR
jgi:hypothetical protein